MQTFGNPLHVLDTVDSSNNYAMERVHARLAKHGEAYFAHTQTAGKGQRGKSWTSEPGANIVLSVVVEPTFLQPANTFPLSAITALACHDLLNSFIIGQWHIKWPNDLYWNDRKAGGILIENRISGHQWEYAVIGVGININQQIFDPNLPNPVSLTQLTGMVYDTVALARKLCEFLQQRYDSLAHAWPHPILDEFQSKLFGLHSSFRFRQEAGRSEAMVMGITTEGKLLLGRGKWEESFGVGELQWDIGQKIQNPSVDTEGTINQNQL